MEYNDEKTTKRIRDLLFLIGKMLDEREDMEAEDEGE